MRLRFDDTRTCAGACALLCVGALVLALPVLGHRAGMAACGFAGLLVGASPILAGAVRRMLVRRQARRAEHRREDVTWYLSSESDVRWNAQGRCWMGGYGEPPQLHRAIYRLRRRLGPMPTDLQVTYERDRT